MFIKLEDASTLTFDDERHTPVASALEYYAWQAEKIASRGLARVMGSLEVKDARVCHGRWIVDCACGVGVFTHPEWKTACCAQCGTVYTRIVFPWNISLITQILLERPSRENQNWFPHETVDMLLAENAEHLTGSAR